MKDIEHSSETEERIATLFRALGNPARVWILSTLAKAPHSAGQLVASLPLAQSTVSEHLGVLKQAGIVRTTRGARWYSLQPEVLDTIIAFCQELQPDGEGGDGQATAASEALSRPAAGRRKESAA